MSMKLVIGCGYLGERVARRWVQAQAEVAALTRSPIRAQDLSRRGIQPIIGDVTNPASLKLPAAETVVFAVGFDRHAGKPIEEVYVQGLRNVLAALPQPPQRFIYVSSTGVYGQTSGEVIDEDSECRPTREGGKACLAAEELLGCGQVADWTAANTMILRLAGIYGPGRIPRIEDIRAGRPIAAPSTGYLNLIHVEDAADIVLAVERLTPPRLYVVSDGHPVERGEYYRELARLLDAPPPVFVPPPADAHVAARAGSDKRIHPARLLKELGITLRFPRYREGLAEIVKVH
jgi:nucleoside-diphosphate-sugar epimerase